MFLKLLTMISATCIITVASSQATAAANVRCDVMTIQASNEHKGIDPKLSPHQAIFKQKPFSNFDSFALLETRHYILSLPGKKPITLPKPFSGQLTLNRAESHKFSLSLNLKRPQRKPIVINGVATPGAPLFAAGFKNARGVLIFGIACKGTGINL